MISVVADWPGQYFIRTILGLKTCLRVEQRTQASESIIAILYSSVETRMIEVAVSNNSIKLSLYFCIAFIVKQKYRNCNLSKTHESKTLNLCLLTKSPEKEGKNV